MRKRADRRRFRRDLHVHRFGKLWKNHRFDKWLASADEIGDDQQKKNCDDNYSQNPKPARLPAWWRWRCLFSLRIHNWSVLLKVQTPAPHPSVNPARPSRKGVLIDGLLSWSCSS